MSNQNSALSNNSLIERMYHRIRTSWFVSFTIACVGLAACQPETPDEEKIARLIRYYEITDSNEKQQRSLPGIVKAGSKVDLSFRNGGVMTYLHVNKGDRVSKGALIARIDNLEANLDFENSISDVNRAKSSLRTQKSEFERVRHLYQDGSVSIREYEQAKNSFEDASSQYESAVRNSQIRDEKRKYGYIYAPSDGIIAQTYGKVNERVAAGSIVAELIVGDRLIVEVGVPAGLINKLDTGMNATIEISSLNSKQFSGTIDQVSPIAYDNATTFPVDVAFNEPEKSAKAGMAATVVFNLSKTSVHEDSTLTIPFKAVGEDGAGNFVFLLESINDRESIARKKYVEIGKLNSDGITILNGLSVHNKIVTAGIQTLIDGQIVRVK